MLDYLNGLRSNPLLLQLLAHYATLAAPNRDVWQDRLMVLDGVDARGLSRLHGQLIAFGWVDQNTGNTPILRAGAVPGCYRATQAGIRAVQSVTKPEARDGGEDATLPVEELMALKVKGRRKKDKQAEQDLDNEAA